jgi:peroxiredoxin
MAQTPSTMQPLGTVAPAFTLPDVDGHQVSLRDYDGAKGYLVLFICNHCPFVVHVQDELARVAKEYQDKGIACFGICANDAANYPDDAPAKLKEQKQRVGFSFPYLVDEDQSVAKAYGAACTPDLFLFDGEKKLFYRGQLDDSRPKAEAPVDGKDLRAALDALLAGQQPPEAQKPATGCNIKWKPGHEPSDA